MVAAAIERQYLPQPTTYPSFAATLIPTTFADAPTGVALPPISVPTANAQARTFKERDEDVAMLLITGIIVAAKGMLSINALAVPETHIISAVMAYMFPPLIFFINSAIIFKTPVCSKPSTTTKSPAKNTRVL